MADKTITPLLPKHISKMFKKLTPGQRKEAMEKMLRVEIAVSRNMKNGGKKAERFFSSGLFSRIAVPVDRTLYEEWDRAMGKFDLGTAKFFRVISTDRMRVELLLMSEDR